MTSSFYPVLFSFSVYGFIIFGVSRSVTIPLDICVHDRPVLPLSLRTFSCFRDLATHEHAMTRVTYDAVYDNLRPFITLDWGFYSDSYPSLRVLVQVADRGSHHTTIRLEGCLPYVSSLRFIETSFSLSLFFLFSGCNYFSTSCFTPPT